MLESLPNTPNSASKTTRNFNETLEAFNGSLIWRATYALIDHKDFEWSPTWIASKLGISDTDAMDALIGLNQLGLIKKTEKGYEQGQLQIIKIEDDQVAKEKLINQHQLLSEEILNMMEPGKKGAYYNFVASGDHNSLAELYNEIKDIFDKFKKKHDLNKSKNDSIFAFSFTTVDVTNSTEGGGKS
jgi:predicted transcriptional regulator